jgi:farnesyl diphosphate synthase
LPDLQSRLYQTAVALERRMTSLISDLPAPGEITRPVRLVEAMLHAAASGGKRLRPFLLIEACRMFGRIGEGVFRAALAVECVHCYSLVHDDLPAMDDNDMRRGKPTVHKAFDEATAILAGDALLTLAFDLMADAATDNDPAIRSELVVGLARAAGMGGMVGGQILDLAAEGIGLDEVAIRRLQAMKTGALIRFSCEAGAIIGRADTTSRTALIEFGEIIGFAFQLADDLLDAAGPMKIGKAGKKDAARGKATLVALYGPDRSREVLRGLVEAATTRLATFGKSAETMVQVARFIGERNN